MRRVLTLMIADGHSDHHWCRGFRLTAQHGLDTRTGAVVGKPPGGHDDRRDARVYSKTPRHGRPHDRAGNYFDSQLIRERSVS